MENLSSTNPEDLQRIAQEKYHVDLADYKGVISAIYKLPDTEKGELSNMCMEYNEAVDKNQN